MLGDLSGGFGGLELDHAEMDAVQPKQKTPAEQLDEQLGITAVNPFAVEQAPRPSMRDRISARRSTRGSDNPINPVMDWLSGTDWSQARGEGKYPVLANLGPKLLNAAGFMNPQIAMLNRLVGLGKSFKEGPKEAGLGLLGALIGSKFGAQGQNIFNTARDIRSNKSTFKQGIGNLFMGQLLSRMGKNRDVGEGILSMLSGEKDPSRAFSDFAIGRAGGKMNPMQQQLFRAGVQTKRGRPAGEAFGSALKNMARRQGMQQLFQRAYQKGGRPAVQKLRAAMSLGGGGG